MKILIATNNASKFSVITPVLVSAGLSDYEFVRPTDLGIALEVHETGSLQNRARQKAIAAYERIKDMPLADRIFLFVGSDDGIRIERDRKTYAASKETTDRILMGQGIAVGDAVSIVRSFVFLTKGRLVSCTTRVPMLFLGNPQGIIRQEGMYPLEYVLAYAGMPVPISQVHDEIRDEQNRKYMLPTIQKTLRRLHGQPL